MSRNAKILLSVFAGLMVCAALCCGGGYLWMMASKDELMATGNAGKEAGEAYAASHTDVECKNESLAQLDQCGMMDMKCRVGAGVFLNICAKNATQTEEFCRGVPDVRELGMTEQIAKTALYLANECERLGRGDDGMCSNHLDDVVTICNERLEK